MLALTTGLVITATSARAQGTTFTYQGRLQSGGAPADGNYDFRFRLAEDPLGNNYAGNPYVTNDITVTNGLFMTTVDFGSGIFAGSNYWLEVDVRTNGTASYTVLAPLQAVTPTPYAIFANTASNLDGTVGSANLSGTYGNALTLNNAANQISGNGSGLTSLNASQLSSGTVPAARLPSTVVTNNETSVTLSGTFSGTGSGLTSLNASQLISGTVPDARQSANVDLLNAAQIASGAKTFTTTVNVNNASGAGMVVQGSTTGGFGSPTMLVQNDNSTASASPALRVVGSGGSSSGVLSVSSQANTGLLADFGNPGAFVSWLDYNGNWTANSFTGSGAGLTGVNADTVGGTQLTSGSGGLGVNTNIFLNDNPIYLRSDVNHGLAYNGPGVTNFQSGSVLPDGPVLWGYTGGALGVMNGGAAAALSWDNSAVTVANGLNVGGNAAVSGTLSAANTPGVNFTQSADYAGLAPGGTNSVNPIYIGQNQNVGIGSEGNLKPAPGYFVIMATAEVQFVNATSGDTFILELSDVTSGSTLLTTASYQAKNPGSGVDDAATISINWVVPTSAGSGYQNFGLAGYYFCPSGSGSFCYVESYNMTVMYFPRLND